MRFPIGMRVAVSAGVLLACAEETTPPVTPASAEFEPRRQPAQQLPMAQDAEDTNKGVLNISEDIRKACGLTDIESYFEYDSSVVLSEYRGVLRKLSECFSTGPLKGRQMRLVGHADPRGDDEYNMLLGGRRSESVRRVIVTEGMDGGKIQTSSRGEMDATGTEEQTWLLDRRVDVLLGD